jgi:hypothetical protein
MFVFPKFFQSVFILSFVIVSCNDTKMPENTPIQVHKSRRIRNAGKRGRIIEKQNVVQIPLTAAENNLKGYVNTVRYRNYLYNNAGKKEFTDSGINKYDQKGNLLEQYAWNSLGKPRWICTYYYNPNGQLKKWVLNMIARGENDTTDFFYDDNGLKTRSITRTGDIVTSGMKEYTYDVHGNEVVLKQYNSMGRLRRLLTSTYDLRDNQIETAELFPDGTVWSKKVATYDANASLTSLTSYLQDSLCGKTIMTNNTNGKHIEITSVAVDGSTGGRTQISYNNQGNILERINIGADGKPKGKMSHLVFSYQYDSNNNPTLERSFLMMNGQRKPIAETVYEYTYYR